MTALGPSDIVVQSTDRLIQNQAGIAVDMSDALLVYRRQGLVDGVPVHDNAKDLLVDSQDQLRRALMLDQQIFTFLQWISPDTPQDKRLQYDLIQQRAIKGQYNIIEQIKQYDPSKSAFIVFVKYAKLTYTLNPRFQHLVESGIV